VAIERPNIRINFQVDKMPGKVLCELKHITKKFGDNTIVHDTHAEINRGDKIALIGANGKGKSTMLRIIAGAESFTGERKWGHNVEESFYAQHQLEALNVNNTLIEEMKAAGSQKTEQELRTLLGCFLFGGDDIDKKIKVLSGGEKARVALAKTIISKANFLMLDEPTNHLDLHSVELLIEALNKYEGSLILVSHDRYFVSKVANTIWEIDNQEIKTFNGGFEEWGEWKERQKQRAAAEGGPKEGGSQKSEARGQKSDAGSQKSEARGQKPDAGSQKAEPVQEVKPPVVEVKPQGPINKELKKELQKQQKVFQQLEEKIAQLNKQKTTLEAQLTAPDTYSDRNKFVQTETEYKKVGDELKQLNKQYEEVFEKIMELEAQS
jgi:ATP-binding cassette, subfamily F, member 3